MQSSGVLHCHQTCCLAEACKILSLSCSVNHRETAFDTSVPNAAVYTEAAAAGGGGKQSWQGMRDMLDAQMQLQKPVLKIRQHLCIAGRYNSARHVR